MDAGANMFLGSELTKRFLGISLLDNQLMRTRSAETLKNRVGITLRNNKQPVFSLSGGQKQAVAIGRGIYRESTRVLILDEPTAALGPEETGNILALIRKLTENNFAIVLIAHNMEHVFAVSDRITVLRRGEMVGVRETAKTSRKEILSLIIGAEDPETAFSGT